MKKRVIFRADGNSQIGLGHIVRCCALAEMLKNDFEIVFSIVSPSESIKQIVNGVSNQILELTEKDYSAFLKSLEKNDIVILDGYTFDTEYQKKIKENACKLICIDDLHSIHFVADAVINQSASVSVQEYSIETYTKLYLGFDYALLRTPFLTAAKIKREIGSGNTAFVSMGGADSNNVSLKVIEAIIETGRFEMVNVLLGSANKNIELIKEYSKKQSNFKIQLHLDLNAEQVCKIIQDSDVAFCPASSIAIECCAVGIPLFVGFTADNQMGILRTLVEKGAAINVGNWNELDSSNIASKINECDFSVDFCNSMMEPKKKLIDGKSGSRLLEIVKAL